jgi:hypothetical protein
MLRSKWPVNATHMTIGLLIVSGVITQCTMIPSALPTQSADMGENTVAIADATQTAPMTSIVSSTTPTPNTAPTVPTMLSSTPDIPILPPGGPGAATKLQSEVDCAEPGRAVARLSWTPASIPGSAQRVDVTIYSFDTKYDSSMLLSADQTSLVWEPLRGQAIHDWRVLTLQVNGWVPSETASFEGPTCIVEIQETEPPIP